MNSAKSPTGPRMNRIPVDLNDLIGLVGLVALGVGLWLWWPPASLMITGGLLIAAAALRAWITTGQGGK